MGKDKAESTHFTIEKIKHPTFLVELPVEYRRAPNSRIRPGLHRKLQRGQVHGLGFREDSDAARLNVSIMTGG